MDQQLLEHQLFGVQLKDKDIHLKENNMQLKNLEFKSKSKSRNSYHVICGDIIIGSITNFTGTEWIIESKLPNTNNMIIKQSKDEAVKYMEDKLLEFYNAIVIHE